nr:hypothetical protein [Tanacetum cinerariifolium]
MAAAAATPADVAAAAASTTATPIATPAASCSPLHHYPRRGGSVTVHAARGVGFATVGVLVSQVSSHEGCLSRVVANLEQDNVAQAIEITKLNKESGGGCIQIGGKMAKLDADEDVTLEEVNAKVAMDADVQGRLEESQAKVYHLDLEHVEKVFSMQDTNEAEPAKVEEQDNIVMRYQALRRNPVTEAHARKNNMIYLKNMAGFKMDFFRGMTYSDIRPIFEKHYYLNQAFLERVEEVFTGQEEEGCKRKDNSLEQRVAKKQRINEEIKELKTHLKIIANDDDDDDVYTEVIPLALKVPVVDYQIHHEHNKPYYKIIRADGTHQLFLSFITLLKNFDREDFEMLWKLYMERSKRQIWISKSQELEAIRILWSLHLNTHNYSNDPTGGKEISFNKIHSGTNNVSLEVEEESEMPLELLRICMRRLASHSTLNGIIRMVFTHECCGGQDMALPPRDQRHKYLRYKGLQYTDADIVDFESRIEMLRDRVYSLAELGGGYLRLKARWDLMLRLCHRLIACSIAGRSKALKKVAVAGAPEVIKGVPDDVKGDQAVPTPVQAPQPPPPTRTMPQRMARLEEDVHEIRVALGEQREVMDAMARDFSRFTVWAARNISQLLDSTGATYEEICTLQIGMYKVVKTHVFLPPTQLLVRSKNEEFSKELSRVIMIVKMVKLHRVS